MSKRLINIDWVIKNYMLFFQKFGMTEQYIREHFLELKAMGVSKSESDYLWYMFQNFIRAIGEQIVSDEQRYSLNIETYSKMWDFLINVENKNGNHVKKLMHENELKLWKLQATFKTEVEIISGHCCKFCDGLDGKQISFNEALGKQYLASKQCTREWGCNCCYTKVGVRDKNDRLIPLNK